jgi:hypothetical protein
MIQITQSSWERLSRRVFLTRVGFGFASIAMLGCGGPPAPGRVGQRIERGGIAFEVKEVVRRTVFSRYNATTRAKPDQTFVLARMLTYNISAPAFGNDPVVFTLMTAEGRIFKPLSVGFEMPEPSHFVVTPGMRSHETAVFEVPSASGGLTLSYQPPGLTEIRVELPPPAELPTEREP